MCLISSSDLLELRLVGPSATAPHFESIARCPPQALIVWRWSLDLTFVSVFPTEGANPHSYLKYRKRKRILQVSHIDPSQVRSERGKSEIRMDGELGKLLLTLRTL